VVSREITEVSGEMLADGSVVSSIFSCSVCSPLLQYVKYLPGRRYRKQVKSLNYRRKRKLPNWVRQKVHLAHPCFWQWPAVDV